LVQRERDLSNGAKRFQNDTKLELCNDLILFGPYSPLKGYRVAMIEEQGVPIELVETELTDEELSLLEQKEFNK